VLRTEPHVFSNGMCACGFLEPAPPETEAPIGGVEEDVVPAPVVKDGVTSEEVTKMWRHICRYK